MSRKILVIKYGSGSLSNKKGIDKKRIRKYVHKLSKLHKEYQIVIVSSGAVVAGMSLIGHERKVYDSSIYAMAGSAAIVVVWQKLFKKRGLNVGQILVTHNDIKDKEEGGRLRQVIHQALDEGVIPVVNENDVLSDIELAKLSYGGDNDGLASKIAITVGASDLMLLTNVDGLLDSNRQVVSNIDVDNHKLVSGLIDGKSETGRGGMSCKIEAAVQAERHGVKSHIGNAESDYELLLDKKVGTHFN